MREMVKRYAVSIGILLGVAGSAYGLRILWQRQQMGVAAFTWLASSPVDEKGQAIGTRNRAELIDQLIKSGSLK